MTKSGQGVRPPMDNTVDRPRTTRTSVTSNVTISKLLKHLAMVLNDGKKSSVNERVSNPPMNKL